MDCCLVSARNLIPSKFRRTLCPQIKMRVYVQGSDDRRESKDVLSRIAEGVSKRYEIVNPDLKTDLYRAEEADVIVTRLDSHDDAIWALIGFARAGNRPVIPYWGASYDYPDANSNAPKKVYGFAKDFHLRNRHCVRSENSRKPWPSSDINDVVEDLRILEQKKGWRKRRVEKPGKENINLSLPLYIVGDSRNLENAMAFYWIKNQFNECGIDVIIPPEELDGNYKIEDYPLRIDMTRGSAQDCADLASHRSSFIVSRINVWNLVGARWEEGIAWFNSKPILYLDFYLFPEGKSPWDKYKDRKEPGRYFGSVFKQNENLWGIREHAARTPRGLVGEIVRVRNLNESLIR